MHIYTARSQCVLHCKWPQALGVNSLQEVKINTCEISAAERRQTKSRRGVSAERLDAHTRLKCISRATSPLLNYISTRESWREIRMNTSLQSAAAAQTIITISQQHDALRVCERSIIRV